MAMAPVQKPRCNVNAPPLITPASCWPMVPLTLNTPPVLVPPPPSMVNQSTEKIWACAATIPAIMSAQRSESFMLGLRSGFHYEHVKGSVDRHRGTILGEDVPTGADAIVVHSEWVVEIYSAGSAARIPVRGYDQNCVWVTIAQWMLDLRKIAEGNDRASRGAVNENRRPGPDARARDFQRAASNFKRRAQRLERDAAIG